MSPIAFGVSDYPPAIRRLFWFGGPRFASLAAAAVGRSDLALPLDTVALCLESPCHLVGVWFSASPMRAACWCSRKLPGGVLRLSSFASCFPACFRFLFRCFDRSATFSFLFRCLAPIGSLSLLFDFAGAADAMSPLRVGSGGDETVVGRLVSPGCRLCLLALLFFCPCLVAMRCCRSLCLVPAILCFKGQ